MAHINERISRLLVRVIHVCVTARGQQQQKGHRINSYNINVTTKHNLN